MSKNSVLSKDFRVSDNFYLSDKILQHFLRCFISPQGAEFMYPHWHKLGHLAATEMNHLSMRADKEGPKHIKRNYLGENIDEISFHPDYWRLVDIAVESKMFQIKWHPTYRENFGYERNKLSFAAGYLYAMTESGVYCPLCMTDGVALLLDKYAEKQDALRLLPHIYTSKKAQFFTGAMFLTEKVGGSDVGANLVEATLIKDKTYALNGEKWFCSNANAQIIFALARTDKNIEGTRGLGIFLLEQNPHYKNKNAMELVRLKDKLGVRSMASGEYIFHNTKAKLVGGATEGFKIMAEMMNLSRLYNSVAALSAMRRALIEAYQYLSFRNTFGKPTLSHALIRTKLEELGSINIANFYLTWSAIAALDAAENGNTEEAEILRFVTPMVKKITAEDAVYVVRESMELMGGIGYIEDGIMPKIMRDVMVLPIWEGAGNIMLLDMLRASAKSKGWQILMERMQKSYSKLASEKQAILLAELSSIESNMKAVLQSQEEEIIQASIKPIFEKFTRLYQVALMLEHKDKESEKWINPAIDFWLKKLQNQSNMIVKPLDIESIKNLIAWTF